MARDLSATSASSSPACIALSSTRIHRALHPSKQFLIRRLSAYQSCLVARHSEIAIQNEVVGDPDFLQVFQLDPEGHATVPISKLGLLIRNMTQYPQIITKRKTGTVSTVE